MFPCRNGPDSIVAQEEERGGCSCMPFAVYGKNIILFSSFFFDSEQYVETVLEWVKLHNLGGGG